MTSRQDARLENILRQAAKTKLTGRYRRVNLVVVVSCVSEDFLCQTRVTTAMLFIVKGWYEGVET